jgi:hypothetical protein
MLDAEMNRYYWDLISARYARWDRNLKLLIAVAASGTVAGWSIWSRYPDAWKGFSALACVAALAHPYLFSSDVLKRTSELVAAWKELFIDYDLLWFRDADLHSADSWSEFETIKRRETHLDETRLPQSKRLLEKAYRHVLEKRRLTNG